MSAPSAPAAAPVARPPAHALAMRHFRLSALAAVAAGFALAVEPWTGALALLLLYASAMFAGFGWLVWRDAWGSAHAGVALQALTRGDLDAVAAAHARIPARSLRRGTVARSVAVQRALVAMLRGAPADAIAAIEPALSPRVRLTTTTHERMQMASGYGVRALAHAMNGDAARAHEDAARAESFPEAMPDALARAALARTLVLARSGEMKALATQLSAKGSLMLENTLPRERALLRALRKMAHARARSVYREPSRPFETASVPGALAGWIAKVAPEAAAYAGESMAPGEHETQAGDVAPGENEAQAGDVAPGDVGEAGLAAQRGAARPPRRRLTRKAAALPRARVAAGATALLTAIPLLIALASAYRGSRAPLGAPFLYAFSFDPSIWTVLVVVIVILTGIVTSPYVRARRLNLALIAASRAAALGDVDGASVLLAKAKKSSMPLFAAAAGGTVARLAEQRGDFALCLEECDAAIAKIVRTRSSESAEQVMPPLLGLRALALAATGRATKAWEELETLRSRYPSFGHLAVLELRVRLANAVRTGNLAEARRVALSRTAEVPLPLRDDLLADLVLAVTGAGLPDEERQQLDAELRADPATQTWIDAMAPRLRHQLASVVHGGVRVAGPTAEREREPDDEHPEPTEEAPVSPRRSSLRL